LHPFEGWYRRQQAARVGMLRVVEHLVAVAFLCDPSVLHDDDTVGDLFHDA
jgi:hypothetical protein